PVHPALSPAPGLPGEGARPVADEPGGDRYPIRHKKAPMLDLERAVAALARRVRALEDELAIHKVIARYGPAVDAGDGAGAAAVFTDDGVYDVDVGRDGGTRRGRGNDRRGSPSGDGWPLRTSDGTGHRHPRRRPRAPEPSATRGSTCTRPPAPTSSVSFNR